MSLISPNGLAIFYKKSIENGVRGRTWLQDIAHLAWAGMSVTAFFHLDSSCLILCAFTLSLSSFRLLDLLIDFVMLAVFGNRYGRPWAGAMQPQRLQRTLIVDILLLLELVFWNASWIFVISKIDHTLYAIPVEYPDQALQVSFSTATTIGYGTYAPVKTPSILAAFLEALSALLLVTGVIGGVLSRISSVPDGQRKMEEPRCATRLNGLPILWDAGWGWRIRYVSPLLIPALAVGLATFWLIKSGIVHN